MPVSRATSVPRTAPQQRVDMGLTALLVMQGLTLFVAIPLAGQTMAGHVILDACHLAFAMICIGVLTRDRGVRIALVVVLMLLVAGQPIGSRIVTDFHLDEAIEHETISCIAFAFNAGVTALVARHVFAPGKVTVHHVRGAVLIYLNIAALFAIAYGVVAMNLAGAFASAHPGHDLPGAAGFVYFSFSTITTTGYGDITPVHPIARSLANLEAVIGQLFPATLLTRLVSLHLAHGGAEAMVKDG